MAAVITSQQPVTIAPSSSAAISLPQQAVVDTPHPQMAMGMQQSNTSLPPATPEALIAEAPMIDQNTPFHPGKGFYIQIADNIGSETEAANKYDSITQQHHLLEYQGIVKFDEKTKTNRLLLGPFQDKDQTKAQNIARKLNVKFVKAYLN